MLRLFTQCNNFLSAVRKHQPAVITTVAIASGQNRQFSTTKNPNTECPFKLLGVPTQSKYSNVKSAFLKLAMTTHPDMVLEDEKESAEAQFIKIRMAFEQIRPLENGVAALVDSDDNGLTSDEAVDEFDDWFYSKTGRQAPIGAFQLDRKTIQEVKSVYEEQVPGGLDKGGMWHLAGMIANSVKGGDVLGGVPKLDAGDNVEVVRSRRRRKR